MGLDAFYNNTVTLYNKYLDKASGKEIWFPTLLENVSLIITNSTTVSQGGKQKADAGKLLVDVNRLPKPYIEPVAWKQLPEDIRLQYITFTEAEDFFVEGNTTNTEIMADGFYEWMRKQHDNVFKISDVKWYRVVMPHFEIGGL